MTYIINAIGLKALFVAQKIAAPYNLNMIAHKRTKIVATLGPASSDYETIKALIENGVNVARLNFSHGTQDEQLQKIQLVKKIAEELHTPVAIMQDLQGPKIRLGNLESESRKVKKGEKVSLFFGTDSNDERLPVQFNIFPFLKPGVIVFVNDGIIALRVEHSTDTTADCVVEAGGELRSRKGVNIPGVHLKNVTPTDKDKDDLSFGLKQFVDYVAVSFVQDCQDIENVRKLFQNAEHNPKIVAKIECQEAVKNLEAIVKEADAVMVARGDLALEVGQEEVPLIQRNITRLAKKYHTPVIVATQMLESMIHNSEPTRAEVNDIATAVLDRVDAVMLSAESAHGDYPVEAVKVMAKIIERVEKDQTEHAGEYTPPIIFDESNTINAITCAASRLANQLEAKYLAIITTSGNSVLRLSANRADSRVVAITDNETVYRQLALVWGIQPLFVSMIEDNEISELVISEIKKIEKLESFDKVVIVASNRHGVSGNTNLIKVETM